MAVFKEAKAAGLVCSYVSNGNGTPEVLDYIRPWVSLYKVDLKSFRDRHYRELGGTLERVLWTIRALHEQGFWLEIVTLVVPGFNDSNEEFRDIAEFLVSVSPDIPWHVTAFHPDYKMTDPPRTSAEALLRGCGDRRSRGSALRLHRQPSRPDEEPREHLLPGLPGARSSSGSASPCSRTGSRTEAARIAAARFPASGDEPPAAQRARRRPGLTAYSRETVPVLA